MTQQDVFDCIRRAPVALLLNLGREVAPTDYAVAHYNHKPHRRYFHNRAALEKALRRVLTQASRWQELEENWRTRIDDTGGHCTHSAARHFGEMMG
jgi:hypothetical protein